MQIVINLLELGLYTVSLEIYELIFNISQREEGPHLVSCFKQQVHIGIVWLLIREGRLSEGYSLVQVDLAAASIHFIWFI